MQRHKPQSVGDVLRDLLEETSLQNRIDELKAAELWHKIVGGAIAEVTGKPSVRNGVMSVGVPNASLRNELHMNRSRLKDIINETLGKQTISEIRFIS